MTTQHDNILTTLTTLTNDLSVVWDEPARIYFLLAEDGGTIEDPIARLCGLMPTHPVDDIRAAYEVGMRVPPDAIGLVVASEGWRHLSITELLERNPDMIEKIKASMKQALGYAPAEDENIQSIIKNYYYDRIMPSLPGPSQMPEDMRVEIRTVCAVLRDGTCFSYSRSRDLDDGSGDVMGRDMLAAQRVPTAMYMLLHDVLPDGDCEDPFQVVSDYQTLQALADLPTTDG